MHYLYDIWVNWFDGEEKGYNVYPYHEWRKQDNIEMIDQIPVLYITEQLFNTIENGLFPLPNQLLKSIHKKTYIRKGYGRRVVAYACIITNGNDVLAIDTNGYEMPLRKSRLIPRQERQVIEMCGKINKLTFELPRPREDNLTTKKYIWQLQEKFVIGLTRRERTLKKILFICLDQLKQTENKKEISYWLSEWERTNALRYTKELSIDEIWQRLYEQALDGWSAHHEKFLSQLIRGYPMLKNEWNEEQSLYKNKENQK